MFIIKVKTELKDRQYELNELMSSYDVINDKLSKKLLDFIHVTTNVMKPLQVGQWTKKENV